MASTPVVLNVEDFAPARYLRSRVLRDAGFEVIEADTVAAAFDAVAASLPDLALLDIDLPDGNGFSMCEILKTAHPELPVLLVSAVHITAAAAHEGQLTGADAFLREPVAPETLVRHVADALNGIRDEASLNFVITDRAGFIIEASAEAAHLLNMSAAHLRQRSLLVFFDSDRAGWAAALRRASDGQILTREGVLRPRDRRPIVVEVEVIQMLDHPQRDAILWSFRGPAQP